MQNTPHLCIIKFITMKKFLLSLMCVATGMVAMAQNFTVTGTVTDNNGNPVNNHQIWIISADSAVFSYYNSVYTDVNGNYSDVIPNGAQIGPNIDFQISTYDNCNPNTWSTITLSNNQGTITSGTADFTICDSNFYSYNCMASFYAVDSANTGNYYFVNMSYGNGLSYAWDFGDGNTSTQANPTHFYMTPGTYTVCLTISNGNCSDTYCYTLTAGTTQCQAYFYSYIDSLNDVVYLVDLSNPSTPNFFTTYFWDFGDGNTSTLQYPTHTYASSGLYLICLTITDNSSCTSTYCDSVGIVLFGGGENRSGFTVNVIPPASLGTNEISTSVTSLNLFPNPATENAVLNYNASVAGNHQIVISDISGKIISAESFAAQKGNNSKAISLNEMSAGIYILSVTDESGNAQHLRLIKE
jgi:3D (Asp-Asp-Asp) domain-containing protein